MTATRITGRSAPFIDGYLESVWQDAGVLGFPDAARDCFTIEYQNPPGKNPSTFTVYFLHDDVNLYVAVQTTDDTTVEGSSYDQNADGLAGLALARKTGGQSMFRLLWHQDQLAGGPAGPPIDRDGMVAQAEWRRSLVGTWNDNRDVDGGYVFEFSIPLATLGGWLAGEQILANIVLVDHDAKPGAPYNDPDAYFRKCYWGSDTPEDLSVARWIVLGNEPPIGTPGDDRSVTALRIKPPAAPRVDGRLDDVIWQVARPLRFPNAVGRGFTPGPSVAPYATDDPSGYTLRFLHDDTYLYVAVSSDDGKLESAAYDQASDGLISLVFEVNGGGDDARYSTYWYKLDQWEWFDRRLTDCDNKLVGPPVHLHFQEGAPRYPYETPGITWGPTIAGSGTWNNNSDRDAGYAFEYRIPLQALGGYVAGQAIPANIVLIDHDDKPGAASDDPQTHFRKFWWGFDGNEFYPPDEPGRRPIPPEQERYVVLGDRSPVGPEPPPANRAARAIRYIVSQQLPYSGLIRSYPDQQVAHTYDNAVALIALTHAGEEAAARRLAAALVSLLEANGDGGFFYDAYGAVDSLVSQGTLSGTGPNAWAALALTQFGRAYGDSAALAAAAKVTTWLLQGRPGVYDPLYDAAVGGVWGGVCHPFEETPGNHDGDSLIRFKSTEQVLDVWQLFTAMGRAEVDSVRTWLRTDTKGWVQLDARDHPCKQNMRFSRGANDPDLALDAQAWGSAFASLTGDTVRAALALAAAERRLLVSTAVGGQTIVGFGDSCETKDGIVWYEGTAHMIVGYALRRDLPSARRFLDEMRKVQNTDGSWNHSSADSVLGSPSFHRAAPHVGATAWMYFALVDVEKGWKLPFVAPTAQPPTATATPAATATRTPTPGATRTPAPTATSTPTASFTRTPSSTTRSTTANTPSATSTASPTVMLPMTATPTPTGTPASTATYTATPTPTPTSIATATPRPDLRALAVGIPPAAVSFGGSFIAIDRTGNVGMDPDGASRMG